MSDTAHYLQTHHQLIEQHLNKLIPEYHNSYQPLFDATRYALLGGGKRLRPILTLATVQMLEGNTQAALTPACILELIHTYSLIHDDLPCMDNDDFRRGKLTVHKKFSEGLAVLTGDYLLTVAFEILANSPHLSAEKKVKLISLLSRRIGSEGMIGGQVMDINLDGKNINLETLRLLHRNKTGALITTAVEFGGIITDVNDIQFDQLRQFGENIGLAFQIIDDILDVTSSQIKHGRTVSSDLINKKSTYITLLGLEQSQVYAKELFNKAIAALKMFPHAHLLTKLADFMIHRKY